MVYNIYKFNFITPLHTSNSRLENCSNTIMADTLFSALCVEFVNLYGESKLNTFVDYAKNSELVFSDMFPFIENTFFIPKPFVKITTDDKGDSTTKKLFKKLKYISTTSIDNYLSGNLNPKTEVEKISKLGAYDIRTMSSSKDEEKAVKGEMLPFNTGIFKFSENSGLYMIVGVKNNDIAVMLDNILKSLSYSGIGGKRSSGFGKFEFKKEETPNTLQNKLNTFKGGVLLSTSMAKNEELEKTLINAKYLLVRRAGFSNANKKGEIFRKRDFYAFTSGSYFENGFTGDIFNVATHHTNKVYKYAKPLFLEVNK